MDLGIGKGTARRGGKKNRKFGRAGRRPSKARYNGERRWEKNKAKRIAKQARKEEKKRIKLEKRARRTNPSKNE
jgi:hypothetical protein